MNVSVKKILKKPQLLTKKAKNQTKVKIYSAGRFSKVHLLGFAVVFAGIGGYTLISSFAATGPNPMPLISRNVPAYASAGTASSANDSNYATFWQTASVPATLSYDLSGVSAAQRGQVLLGWYNDPMTSVYDHTAINDNAYNNIRDYTIQANAAAGGSLPASGWQTLVTVTGNRNHSRQHLVNLTGYNWIRISVTASDGSSGNSGVGINVDVHDASQGTEDSWLFLGDSVTQDGMYHRSTDSNSVSVGPNFSQLINASKSNYYPAYEDGGIGGWTSGSPLTTNPNSGQTYLAEWLNNFPGRYVSLAYGANDANNTGSSGGVCGSTANQNTFYSNMATMVQAITAAGKVPVVPKIHWAPSANLAACGQSFNTKIDQLYTNFPQIIHGPDFWTFYQSHPNYISNDNLHPNATGYTGMRQQWADTMLANVYNSNAPDTLAPAISSVRTSAVSTTGITASWTTNEASTTQVEYGPTTSYGSTTTLNSTLVTAHSAVLSGLSAGTTYHYRVRSTDAADNTAVGSDKTFTTAVAATGTALHAVGNKLYNSAGQQVMVHGVNKSGSEYACVQGWGFFDSEGDAQPTSADEMASWTGLNAVRVPLNESCWLGINGSPAAYSGVNYRNAIKAYVDQLTAAGLMPILELHWAAPGTTLASQQRDMPDRDHTPTFWSQVANDYKGYDNVIFDLFNEPNGLQWNNAGWTCWRDGGNGGNCSPVPYTVAGMQELVTAVRDTGAQNLIMLGGQSFANLFGIPGETNTTPAWIRYKPTDPLNNLAASWHIYGGNTCDAIQCWEGGNYAGSTWNGDVAKVAAQYPLIAGEIGEHYDGNHCTNTFVTNLMGWLDTHEAGYVAWNWNTWNTCLDLVTNDSTGAPTTWGTTYKNHIAALSGAADTTAPQTTITGQPASLTNQTSASFSFSATETATFQCKLDSGSYTSCTSPKTYTGLANGSHTFSVFATDSAANPDSTPATYAWTIDTNAPTNLALNKVPTTSAGFAQSLALATDGDKNSDNYVNLSQGATWVQIDLGQSYNLNNIKLWHYYDDGRSYHDVAVQLSNSATFASGVTTVFNNDANNSLGLGSGTDSEYAETSGGKSITFSAVNARYVRLWSNGSTANTSNHYVEVEAYAAATAPANKNGDLNSDNLVNIFDLSILLSNYGKAQSQSTNAKTDLNSDGVINIFDLSILLSNYGK